MALHKTTWTVSSGTTLQQFWLELIFWFRYFVCPLATTNEGSNPSTLFLPTNWAKLCLVKCSFYKATMIVFSLSLADGLLVLNGHRGGTASARWSKTCPSSVACLLVSCPMGFHCIVASFEGLLQPLSHSLITFGLISVPPSLLHCCFWPAFTGSDLAETCTVQKMLVHFILGEWNLFDCVPLFSLFPPLCVCVSAHMEVVEFNQLVSSPSSARWQLLSNWWSPTGLKQKDVCIKVQIRLGALLSVFIFHLAAVLKGPKWGEKKQRTDWKPWWEGQMCFLLW